MLSSRAGVVGAAVEGEDILGVVGVAPPPRCEAEREEVALVGTRGGRRMAEGGEEGEASLAGLGRGDLVTLGQRWSVRSTSSGKSVLRTSVSEGDLPEINIL